MPHEHLGAAKMAAFEIVHGRKSLYSVREKNLRILFGWWSLTDESFRKKSNDKLKCEKNAAGCTAALLARPEAVSFTMLECST